MYIYLSVQMTACGQHQETTQPPTTILDRPIYINRQACRNLTEITISSFPNYVVTKNPSTASFTQARGCLLESNIPLLRSSNHAFTSHSPFPARSIRSSWTSSKTLTLKMATLIFAETQEDQYSTRRIPNSRSYKWHFKVTFLSLPHKHEVWA